MTFKKIKYYLLTKTVGQYINVLCIFSPEKASKLAYELFSEPRTGKLSKEKLPKTLKEPQHETFHFNDNTFQTYIWKGNQDIILLVHGWESNASRWKKILPYLKKSGKTIIAIDAPAHGLSSGKEFTVPKYAEVIQELVKKYNPKILIGHSIGGAACIYYQYLNQNPNIEKMVLLGSPSDLKNLIINYCNMLSLTSTVQFHLENTFSEKFNLKVDDFSGKKFGAHINTKALIVHDAKDDVVSINEGKKIATHWKNSTFVQTSGLGHSLHSKYLYKKIEKFLFEA